MPPDRNKHRPLFWLEDFIDGFITRNSDSGVPFNFEIGEASASFIDRYEKIYGQNPKPTIDMEIMKEWKLFDEHPEEIRSCIDKIAKDEIEYRKNNKFVSFEEMMGGIKE